MAYDLDPKTISDFWKRAYLGVIENPLEISIKRAYLDFCRTDHGISNGAFNDGTSKMKEIIVDLKSLCNTPNFDYHKFHEKACKKLEEIKWNHIAKDGVKREVHLSIGQAQKWINMTLKYLVAFEREEYKYLEEIYGFLHIPIDGILIEKLSSDHQEEFDSDFFGKGITWSRIDNYDKYLEYQ